MKCSSNPSAEMAAFEAFGKRVSRTRGIVAGVCAVTGIAAAVPSYLLLRSWSLAHLGWNLPYATGAIAFGLPFVASWKLGRFLGNRIVRANRARWVQAIANEHGVPPEVLNEAAFLI
jgi:hypothetical protein